MSLFTKIGRYRENYIGLVSSSGLLILAQIGGVASGFLLMLLLARTIDQEGLGRITTGFSLAMLLAVVTTANLEAGNFRFLSAYIKENKIRSATAYMRTGLKLVVGTGLVVWVVSLLVWLFSSSLGIKFPNHIFMGILAAPLFGWLRINSSHMHAKGEVLRALLPRSILRPLILLIVLAVATLAGIQLNSNHVMLTFIGTLAFVALIQNHLNRQAMAPLLEAKNADYSGLKKWIFVGFQTLIPIFFVEYSTDIIIVSSSAVLPENDLAVLGIILRIVGLLSFGVAAVNMAFSPQLAMAFSSSDRAEVNRLLTLGGQLKLWLVLFGYIFLIYQSDFILGIFGPSFKEGKDVLTLLATMPLILVFFGPATFSMTVLDLQKWGILVFAATTIGLVVLVYLLGRAQGLYGVGIAVIIVWFFWNLALYGVVRLKRGYDLSLIGSVVRMIRRSA
jgi:O-antigen/teichoic acid export membrane protein